MRGTEGSAKTASYESGRKLEAILGDVVSEVGSWYQAQPHPVFEF